MLNAEQLIEEANALTSPNAGIQALADMDYCIMDEIGTSCPYKEENRCPDFRRCSESGFMLACVQSRTPDQIANWVIEAYQATMEKVFCQKG